MSFLGHVLYLSVILEFSEVINFRIFHKVLEFIKINSSLIGIPGVKCSVKYFKL